MSDLEKNLSILLDDHSEAGIDSAIDDATGDVNLQYRMRRYRMIGEVMRHELPQAVDIDFHNSVMAKVRAEAGTRQASADEPRVSPSPQPGFGLGWLRPAAGLALAAGVAVVTVALWQPQQEQLDSDIVTAEEEKIKKLAGQQVQSAVPASTNVQGLGMRWKVQQENPKLQQKLNAYLVNHTEYSNSVQGLIPQARVAGFDNRQQ